MDLNLEKKIVLITGGAMGIGAAITKLCAQEGVRSMKQAIKVLHVQSSEFRSAA